MWVTWVAPAHKQTPLKEKHGIIMAERELPDRADEQGAGTTAELPSVPWLWGKYTAWQWCDTKVTLKAFLLRRQVDAFQ